LPSKKPQPAKSAQRVIKKYPNRRLYDTDTSSYITLVEVKQLVMDAEPFVVRDAKTGDDLTRSILLQIILEAEAGGAPVTYSGVAEALTEENTQVLLFGKPEARPQRRMGVALARGSNEAEARRKADTAAAHIRVRASS
jgi:polyhydroxyalkanoate synthesis repressor PhaR